MRKKTLIICSLIFSIFLLSNQKEKKTLILTATEWLPYTSELLPEKGFLSEITTEAFNAVGYEVDIQFFPWSRCIYMTKAGEADGILSFYFTKQRNQYFQYTNEITTATVALIKRKNSTIPDNFNNFKDLEKFSFGLTRNNAHTTEFDNAKFLSKDYADSPLENLTKFLKGRFDILAASSLENILRLLSIYYPAQKDQIKVLDPILNINKVYNAFSRAVKDHKIYIKDFNRGLNIIKKNGTYQNILERHGIFQNK